MLSLVYKFSLMSQKYFLAFKTLENAGLNDFSIKLKVIWHAKFSDILC